MYLFLLMFYIVKMEQKSGPKMSHKTRECRVKRVDQELLSSTTPVDPVLLTNKVKAFLTQHGGFFSKEVPDVIEKLCKLLNYSISNPIIGGYLNRKNILIYPAQTGIGKSVSVQHYVAMLGKESSLIVVNTIKEAEEYCSMINSLRNQPGYARFSASKKTHNSDQITDVEMLSTSNAQCLVVTHAMFLQQQYAEDSWFKYYQQSPEQSKKVRDLVVIDERLSFLSKRFLKFDKLEGLRNFLAHTAKYSPRFKDDHNVHKQLKAIQAILDVINEEDSEGRASFIDKLSIEPKLEDKSLSTLVDFESVSKAVADRLDEINDEIGLLKGSKVSNIREVKNEVVDTLNLLIDVTKPKQIDENVINSSGDEVYGEFATYKRDLYLSKSIFNQFGTAVVLDATAELNSFFKQASSSNSNIDIIAAPKIRKYKNLIIYKAQGIPQSATAVFQKSIEVADANAKFYGNIIREILGEDDKLLVISFKGFLSNLEDEFVDDDRVVFTNWGQHVGRNDWRDCNKVILIGWLRLPEEELVSKLFNISSMGTSDVRVMKHVTPDNLKMLQRSEIADDLVQGAMRCCARIINTDESDCKSASIYLFQDVHDGSKQVIKLFEDQFPEAKIVEWKPKTTIPKSTLSKPNQKKEQAIEHLVALSQTRASVSRSEFCNDYEVRASTMTRWLKSGYFKNRLDELGFTLAKPEGKPERFYFNKP
ncbi:MAG: Uncharacterised protein [Marinobacterium sp. xm-d-530]|nr:MAG: Uncharacterised protein [Marinobacterium sp. xm-d-530]